MNLPLKNWAILLGLGILFLFGCTKPILIEVDQSPRQLAISSAVTDLNTLLLMVSYSTTSLANLNKANSTQTPLGYLNDLLVDSATALLHSGTHTDTLQQVYRGIYTSNTLNLTPFTDYTLQLRDNNSGMAVQASATYLPMVPVDTLQPVVTRTASSTSVSLHLVLQDDPARTDYYLISYSSVNPATAPSAIGSASFGALAASPTKQLDLFTDADAVSGRITRDLSLTAELSDTLYVQLGRIEKGYFEYLTAYKRTGQDVTDLISEPVSLPGNVLPGLGYFALYEPKRQAFILARY